MIHSICDPSVPSNDQMIRELGTTGHLKSKRVSLVHGLHGQPSRSALRGASRDALGALARMVEAWLMVGRMDPLGEASRMLDFAVGEQTLRLLTGGGHCSGDSRLTHAFENGLKLGQMGGVVHNRRPCGAGAGDCEG